MITHITNIIQSNSLFLIAGPCAIENKQDTFSIATELKEICQELEIPLIFKGSYRKANRTRLDSFQGIGDEEALSILGEVHAQLQLPTITDIHTPKEAQVAAAYVQMLQIPAFLCRQTDLIIAAAQTGLPVNIKKGQFMSASSMEHAIEKVTASNNDQVFITERGNCFGYSDLVVDITNIPKMQAFGGKVIMDCTHSLQQPNQSSGVTGGNPEMIGTIANAAVAANVDGLFIETHPNPSNAKSDGANMLPLNQIKSILTKCLKIRAAIS